MSDDPRGPLRDGDNHEPSCDSVEFDACGCETSPPGPAAHTDPGQTDPVLGDWEQWLGLSSTPSVTSEQETKQLLWVSGGLIVDPDTWPVARSSRIYAAFDEQGAVYVGQTQQPLPARIKAHFGQQRTDSQRSKAGTWRFIVNASFHDLQLRELDGLERHAAEWLLRLGQRSGRRHPRQP